MRLDRSITLNLVHPLHRICRPFTIHGSRFTGLPVLMYHSISDDPERGVRPYYRVCTGPRRFREQMQWLKDNGYRGVTLSDGLAANSELRTPNSELRPVVLTFDDGFRDFHTAAWPVLQEFGFTATMYLPTAFIGETRRLFAPSPHRGAVPSLAEACSSPTGAGEDVQRTGEGCGDENKLRGEGGRRPDEGCGGGTNLNGQGEAPPPLFHGRDCLTWSEVKELHRAGIEFGSHTVNHPRLVELPGKQVELELQNSKSEIEQRLGASCPAFAFPYAFPQSDSGFACRFGDLLRGAGYETCVTTQIGRHRAGDDRFTIKRLPVNSGDDMALFQAKLEGAYDWLAVPQAVVKKIKRRIFGAANGGEGCGQPLRSRQTALGF